MNREEEAAIIARVLDGDTDAFEPLVTANQSFVYNIALKMLSNPDDAFDVSQETFVKAFRSLKDFKGESSFSSWLYRIAANKCLDLMRKNKKRQVVSIVYPDEDNESRMLELPDARFNPETELERRELRQAINDALDSLPHDQRSILLLRELNGMSYAEIGEALRLEAGTVKSRLFRARANLAKILRESGTFFGK
ncbi:MAG: sigma-70 family RNA polymerase sigma factor [Clostridiales bacterium]|nr:sigma-70 family RNA polymerase sigma factor [Clostridiales bacterium]